MHFAFAVARPLFVIPQRSGGIRFYAATKPGAPSFAASSQRVG
jgi:hypothetical protein